MSLIVDASDVRHVRADDESGAFGILPGHADFITVLAASVITWRNHSDEEHHVAVRGGVLTVRDGNLVEVATREAVREDDLGGLGEAVLDRFRQEVDAEAVSRVSASRLHIATLRQFQRYAQSGHLANLRGMPSPPGSSVSRGPSPGKSERQ